MKRIKLSSPELKRGVLGSSELTETAIIYRKNFGPLVRELVINGVRTSPGPSAGGFRHLKQVIRDELGEVDQILSTWPLQIDRPQGKGKGFPDSELTRLVETFGPGTVDNFFNLRVTVVGAGRLGGPLIQRLARSGFSLVVIDKDTLGRENRPYLPSEAEEYLGEAKAKFWADYCSDRYPEQQFLAVYGDACREEAMELAKGTDLLALAVDEDYVGFIYNLLAVQYRIPILEMGTRSQGSWEEDFEFGGRVRFLMPGVNGCLNCVEGLPVEEITEEAKGRLVEEMVGRREPDYQPVNSLSAVLANAGATQVMSWAAGGLPGPVTELRFREGQFVSTETRHPSPGECPLCNPGGLLGTGDEEPLPASELELGNVGKRS